MVALCNESLDLCERLFGERLWLVSVSGLLQVLLLHTLLSLSLSLGRRPLQMASAHPSMSQSLRMSSTLSGSPFTIEAHADRLIIIRDGGSSRTFSHQRQTSTSSTGSSTSGSRHRHSQSRHHRQSSESGGKSVLAIAYGDGTAVPIPVGVPLSTAEVPQPTAPSTSTAPFAGI